MTPQKRVGMLGVGLAAIALVTISGAGTASAAPTAPQASGLHCTYTAAFARNGVPVYKGTESSGPDTKTIIGRGYIGQSVTYHTSNGSGLYSFITYIGDDHKPRDGWVIYEDVDVTPHCGN